MECSSFTGMYYEISHQQQSLRMILFLGERNINWNAKSFRDSHWSIPFGTESIGLPSEILQSSWLDG